MQWKTSGKQWAKGNLQWAKELDGLIAYCPLPILTAGRQIAC